MKHKKLFISLISVFTVIVAILIFLMIWFWYDRYVDFDAFSESIEIPGIEDGACPQGITNYYGGKYTVKETSDSGEEKDVEKTQNYFFISAYLSGAPSRIYVVGNDTGYVGYVTVKNIQTGGEESSYYSGHCGGIATNGEFLWVASDNTVFCAKASKEYLDANKNIAQEIIDKAAEKGEISFTEKFNANCRASFLYYYDSNVNSTYLNGDKLYVGEFYRDGDYATDETHAITTPDGKENRAFAYEYSVNTASAKSDTNRTGLSCVGSANLGAEFKDRVPQVQKIYSLPEEVQGFAVTPEGHIILSQSYGLKNSTISVYDKSKVEATKNKATYYSLKKQKYFPYDGVTTSSGAPANDHNLGLSNVYVCYVYNQKVKDGGVLIRNYSIPCMSEGLCVVKEQNANRVYVLFESAAGKYRTFVRQVLSHVYAFVPPAPDVEK